MKVIKKLLLLILFQLLNNIAFCCNCIIKEFTQEKINSMGAIFIGKEEEQYYDLNSNLIMIKFSVHKLYKGHLQNDFILASNDMSNCRLKTEKDKFYLFAIHIINNQLHVSICSIIQKFENIDTLKLPNWLIIYLSLPDGYNKTYYKNGKLASEGNLKNNKPEGMWKYYDSLGNIKSFGRYKNAKQDSIWNYTIYSKIGIIKQSYYEGFFHGESIIYYNENTIQRIENYKMGLKNGRWQEFGFYSKFPSESEYLNGKLIYNIQYYENGNKAYLKNDTLEIEWYKNGVINYERHFKNNELISSKCWWENGQLQTIMIFRDSWKDNETYGLNEFRVIFAAKENGVIMVHNGTGYYNLWGIQGWLKDTMKYGLWKYEFNNGTTVECNYLNGIKHGEYILKTDKNIIINKRNYVNGKISGHWYTWYNNGKKHLNGYYKNGEIKIMNFWDPNGKRMIKNGNGYYYFYDDEGNANPYSKKIKYINGQEKK